MKHKEKYYVGDVIHYRLAAETSDNSHWNELFLPVLGVIVKIQVLSKNERRYHVLNNKKVTIINDKIYHIKHFFKENKNA